jgi:CheY-like chemotaxis protein
MARVPSVAQKEQTVRPSAAAVRKLPVAGPSCPHCGSIEIRSSNRRNALDILLACVFLTPFRCRICRERFHLVWRRSLQRSVEPTIGPVLVMPVRHTVVSIDVISSEPLESPTAEPEAPQEEPAEVRTVPAQPILAAVPGSILILEGDLSIRKLLCRLLQRRGYSTAEIAQAEELAAELNDGLFDLLIADVSATGTTDVGALAALAYAHPRLKILALALSAKSVTSAKHDHEVSSRLFALPKPFAMDSFVDCVDRIMERSSLANNGL